MLNRRGIKDARPLLEVPDLNPMYRDFQQQQSSAELIRTILLCLPGDFEEEVMHIQRCHISCSNCDSDMKTGDDEPQTTLTLNAIEDLYPTFEEYIRCFSRSERIDLSCDNCHQNGEHILQWKVRIPPKCKYIAVEMGLFDMRDGEMVRRQRKIGSPGPAVELFFSFR